LLQSSFWALPLPTSALLGVLAGVVYLIGCMRSRRGEFAAMDALIMVVLMAVVTAVTMPLLSVADDQAKATTLTQNLRTFRTQIERYKLDHGGQVPLLYQGSLPQLLEATDKEGMPGPPGNDHPFGPYLSTGIPVNPYTGSAKIELTETFPPSQPGTSGGWLYHQATGRIAADQEGWFDK